MNDQDRRHDADRPGLRGVPIVNGGSGADEHPTQALLDIYTLQRIFSFESKKDSSRRRRFDDIRRKYPSLTKGLDGKTYCFCGDIGRGRTVRSLANLLALYKDVTMVFVYPDHPKLRLSDDLRDYLLEKGVHSRGTAPPRRRDPRHRRAVHDAHPARARPGRRLRRRRHPRLPAHDRPGRPDARLRRHHAPFPAQRPQPGDTVRD